MTRGGRLAAFLVLLPVACGGPTVTPRPPPGPAKAAPGEEGRVTVHVKGMSKRLNLVWPDWPNRVEEALSGLPGVSAVEADVGRDLLQVDYDPKKVTREQILETVGKEGFEAEVIPAGAGPKGG